LIAGIDFESTGLDVENDKVIEIGCCLYEWETAMPMQFYSTLVRPDRPIPPEITKITGITDEQVDCYGKSEKAAFVELEGLLAYADYAMAFNGYRFDHPLYLATCRRLGVEPNGILWLDASADIRFDPEIKTRNLQHLASEFSFVNPFRHRSIFDVLTMLKIASHFSLDDIIARASQPTVYVQIFSSFEDKEKVKALGYRWFAPKKMWWKSAKADDYAAERDTCGFRTELIKKAPE
jgi:DNA polymerase-3 subunit epsilon